MLQGIYFAGDLPSPPYLCGGCQTYATLSGSFTVRNSSVGTIGAGSLQGAEVGSSRVTIGGSPTAGNRIQDVLIGIPIGSNSSVYDVSYNDVSSVSGVGAWVQPLNFGMAPGTHSQFLIHDNAFQMAADAGPWAIGVLHPGRSRQSVDPCAGRDNSIKLQAPLGEGIDVTDVTGTVIAGNTISGKDEYNAIGLWGITNHSTVIGNDIRGVSVAGSGSYPPDPAVGTAQIHIFWDTSDNVVVCSRRTDTALDQGTNNKVIGCAKPVATPRAPAVRAAPAAPRLRPGLFRTWLRLP